MNLRDEIKTTAIVGTAQKEPDFAAVSGSFGETLAKLDRADREKYLLAAAAVNSIWENAGKVLPVDKTDLPEVCDPETLAVLSGNLKQIYETLLNSADKSLLPEFLELMKRQGKIISPELLPLTFTFVEAHPNTGGRDFRHQILPVVGNRGKWLARQMNRWRWVLVEESSEEIFETGKPNERIFALEYLRKKDADKAREFLQKSWKTESANERQKFLEVLRLNLGVSDKEFFDEIRLNDKSVDVRKIAFLLLANFSDSRLVTQVTTLVKPIIRLKKKLFRQSELEIDSPSDWKEKTKDLEQIAKQIFHNSKYFGEKAMALTLALSVVNPRIWEDSLQSNAKEIAFLAHQNDWSRSLLAGFGMAAMRYENVEWFSEILKFNSKFALTLSPLYAWGENVLSYLPFEKINNLISQNTENNFVRWLISNERLIDLNENFALIFQDSKPDVNLFLETFSHYNWKNLVAKIPFQLLLEWAEWLEIKKNKNETKEYEIRLIDEAIIILELRKDYDTEFNNL